MKTFILAVGYYNSMALLTQLRLHHTNLNFLQVEYSVEFNDVIDRNTVTGEICCNYHVGQHTQIKLWWAGTRNNIH